MHSVANLATLQTHSETFFPFKKAPKPSFWVLPREREVLLSQRAHTPLSLSLSASAQLCLNGSRFSHYFIFIPLSDNRNSKICQWKQFYWEFSCIKIQYVGTERETNVIINNKCTFCMFRRRAALCAKCKQVYVSKLLSAKKWEPGIYFFHVSNRHEQVLWKTSLTFETCHLHALCWLWFQ